MKRIICLLMLTLSLTGASKATNHDSIPCLELSARIQPGSINHLPEYSIELWSEIELLSVMSSEKSETFRFDLKKNIQYTILLLHNDSVIKKVFINTKIPWNEMAKGHK